MKTQTGVPFWSPPKRLPKPLAFDAADPLHMQFVVAAANLRAFALGVAPPADCRDAAAVAALLATSAECVVPPFTPTADLTIETGVKEEDERRKALAEAQSSPEGQAAAIAAAVDELTAAKASLPGGFAPKANEFEKDDDTNHHMDFISAVGNLRARNYGIEEIEKFQAKLKAGRIIPAIATTTAMATGFVCLELYKQVAGRPLEARRNLFANLALPGPLLMLSEPMPCPKIKSGQRWDPDMFMDVDEVAYPEGHTLWDKLLVRGASSMTLAQLFAHFTEAHKLTPRELIIPVKEKAITVYSTTLPAAKAASDANLPRQLSELLAATTGAPVSGYYSLGQNIVFETADGDDVKAASVVLHFE